MSTGPADETARRRVVRRRHLHERQAVIFGSLITALVVAALMGLAVWFGVIPAPFSVPFATVAPSSDAAAQPCPPSAALPVPYDQITVNVYNATTRSGLAATTASELVARGIVVATTANDPNGRFEGTALVRAGIPGLAQAYTVAAIFPGAVVVLDVRQDASVDVSLGSEFDVMRTPEEATLDPAAPIAAPEGCFDPLTAAAPAEGSAA